MRQIYIVFILFFCVACSSNPAKVELLAKAGVDYTITGYDQPLDNRFLIVIKSTSSQDICLFNETWPHLLTYRNHPHRGELIKSLDADIRVNSASSTYLPRKPTTGGHCEAESVKEAQKFCSERLEAGQSRTAMLPYAYFDPSILDDEDENKKLTYSANLPFCDVFK